jgi:hypothetical protein
VNSGKRTSQSQNGAFATAPGVFFGKTRQWGYTYGMGVRHPRYDAKGRVYIAEVSNTELLLKNLSASGLCVESQEFVGVLPSARYSVDIVPEEEAGLDQFKLEIESRWIRSQKRGSESGFVIVIPPGSEGTQALERYLAFLAEAEKETGNTKEPGKDTEKD